jgi:hypothetical protein
MRTTLLASILVLTFVASGRGQTAPRTPRNAAEFDAMFQRIKNWAGGVQTISSDRSIF